jgi:ribonuclease PH
VIQADGGTRTAALTGSYVAVRIAVDKMIQAGSIPSRVLLHPVAAISVGVVGGKTLLDLSYEEDSQASIDANIVMNAAGEFIEVQAVAEDGAFDAQTLEEMLGLAKVGIEELLDLQGKAMI